MQSRFSRREHPRNTNRSLFPSFFFFSFIFILFFLFFIRFPRVASWQKKTRGVPPPQVACKNAEWRREFFRSSHRYPDPGRSKIRESRLSPFHAKFPRFECSLPLLVKGYTWIGCAMSRRDSLFPCIYCFFLPCWFFIA